MTAIIPLDKTKLLFRHRSMEMGGVEKVLLSLLNNLDPVRFEITLLLNLDQGELRNEIPQHVRKVFLAPGKEDFSDNRFLRKIQLFRRRLQLQWYAKSSLLIDKNLLGENFDIEIAMDWRDFSSVLNSSNKNSKKIAWFHSEIDHPKFAKLVPQVLTQFPQFDQIIYCSEKIKMLMHQHYPDLKYPKEEVVINAVPIEEIKHKAQKHASGLPKSPLFVSVGRLHTRKGYHKLMEAHAQLLQDGYAHTVLIIGDGEEMQNLRMQQKKLGVEKTFVLAGNRMNPYAYMKKSDFFIMPSESEAWPLVIAEALILEKPIIATDVGDVSTLIRHAETGWLINYSTDEIYTAMKTFLTQPDMVKLIQKNLIGIEKMFDNKTIFDTVEDILLNLAKSH